MHNNTIEAILYTTVLLKKNASYFSTVVFLSIVVNHIGDQNPLLFVFNRVLDTMIGIVLAMLSICAGFPGRSGRIFFLFPEWMTRFWMGKRSCLTSVGSS